MKLTVINHNGIEVVDSREVAEMTGKEHRHLIRDIRGYAEIIENSTEPNFGLSDFFIPNTYMDSTGRTLPCYLLTKKGCDMVANKMTGEKGVLFTAAYVTAFEKMREALTEKKPMTAAQMFAMQAQVNLEQEQRMAALESRFERTESTMQRTMDIFGAPACATDGWAEKMNHEINTIVEQYGGNHQKFRSELYTELERQAGCDLNARQARMRNRMRKGGATAAECRAVTKLQVIAADRKLRLIFEGIVRRCAALYISSDNRNIKEA